MAVDRKADHVGNHGGAYTDNNGMAKQFTYVDHDVKPTIATGKLATGELVTIKAEMAEYRERVYNDILGLSATLAPTELFYLTKRMEGMTRVEWDTSKLENLDTTALSTVLRLLENRAELYNSNLID